MVDIVSYVYVSTANYFVLLCPTAYIYIHIYSSDERACAVLKQARRETCNMTTLFLIACSSSTHEEHYL